MLGWDQNQMHRYTDIRNSLDSQLLYPNQIIRRVTKKETVQDTMMNPIRMKILSLWG